VACSVSFTGRPYPGERRAHRARSGGSSGGLTGATRLSPVRRMLGQAKPASGLRIKRAFRPAAARP
jgi:hypothetical protein